MMNLAEVAGHLIMRRAQLEKGKRNINASEVIGNLTVQNMNLENQMLELLNQIKVLNDQRNAKQTELAKLNGVSAPEPVTISEAELDNGIEQLASHARALAESLKALDEVLAAHQAKENKPAEGDAPLKDTDPEYVKTELPAAPVDEAVLDGRG